MGTLKIYLHLTVTNFTMWMVAGILHGILRGTYVSVIAHRDSWLSEVCITAFLSLAFAAPSFFVVWVVTLIKIQHEFDGRSLFRAALSTAFLLSMATACIVARFFPKADSEKWCVIIFIILSALTSVMVHSSAFRNLILPQNRIGQLKNQPLK